MFEYHQSWHDPTKHSTVTSTDSHGGRVQICFECTASHLDETSELSHNSRFELLNTLLRTRPEIPQAMPGTAASLLVKPLMRLILGCQQGRREQMVANMSVQVLCELTRGVMPPLLFKKYLHAISSRQEKEVYMWWHSIELILHKNPNLVLLLTEQHPLSDNIFELSMSGVDITKVPASMSLDSTHSSSTSSDWRCPFFVSFLWWQTFGAILFRLSVN